MVKAVRVLIAGLAPVSAFAVMAAPPAQADAATYLQRLQTSYREESRVVRWLTGWGDSYLAANQILANYGGNTFHWSGTSSGVAWRW
jgi:hypothetical protein